MGVELFLGEILEPNTDIYYTICPWNQFKLIFHTRLMQFEEKNTHIFLAFEELDIETDVSMEFWILEILSLVLCSPSQCMI